MTVEAAIDALNAAVRGIAGLRRVYVDPLESISEFPGAMTYIESGTYSGGGDVTYGIHTLILDIYEARQVLPQAVDSAKQWPDKVLAMLRAEIAPGVATLDGTVTAIGDGRQFFRYRAMPMEYNANIHYGVRFWIPVKINY